MPVIKQQKNDVCSDERTGQTLIPVDLALERGLSLVNTVRATVELALETAMGRVLAEDLCTPMDLPPFDKSGMDGYAFRSCDVTEGAQSRLTLAGRIAAGDNADLIGQVGRGQAYRIFTGAAIPRGADAVIMQEHVKCVGETITFNEPVESGQNIRRRGEDAPAHSLLLEQGTILGARELGAIASIGQPRVTVRRKITVALFCTGTELKQPGETLAPGQIYNSNRFMMIAALNDPTIELNDMGAIDDDPEKLRAALESAAKSADVIVSTGGVSVGEEDHMVAQLEAVGGRIEVMKIAMKPGKPLSVGTIGQALYVGLPGNPVAAFTTWKIIGAKLAAKIAGARQSADPRPQVVVAKETTRRPGRQEYRPASIVGKSEDGHPLVELLDNTFSAKISLICRAHGFAVLPADRDTLSRGDRLDFVYL